MREDDDNKDDGKVFRIVIGIAILVMLINISLILAHWDEIMSRIGSINNPPMTGPVEFNDAVEVR